MIHTKKGSIVFIIGMFLMVLNAITYSLLRTNSYFISLAREREKYELQYQLIEGLETFVFLDRKNVIEDKNMLSKEIVLFQGPWPDEISKYTGIVILNKKKENNHIVTTIHTKLIDKDTVIIFLKKSFSVI